jgi:hypothetical protein
VKEGKNEPIISHFLSSTLIQMVGSFVGFLLLPEKQCHVENIPSSFVCILSLEGKGW